MSNLPYSTATESVRTMSMLPVKYRLVMRNFVPILQGYYEYCQGNTSGLEWVDIPTVIED